MVRSTVRRGAQQDKAIKKEKSKTLNHYKLSLVKECDILLSAEKRYYFDLTSFNRRVLA